MIEYTKIFFATAALITTANILSSATAFAQCRWISLTNRLPGNSWLSVSFNPKNPRTIYAGGSSLAVSNDGGSSWRALPKPADARDVRMIIIPPQDTTTLFIGGFNPGLWKSSDAGLTWKLVLPEVNFDGVSLVIDPFHPDTMHLGSFDNGFFSSFDRGESWVLINPAIRGFCSMTIRPDSSNVLIGGTRFGTVSKSYDHGRTWHTVTTRRASEVPLVAFDPVNPDNVYASVNGHSDDFGVIKSNDGGETWSGAGLVGSNIWALAIDPSNPSRIFAGGFGSFSRPESAGRVYFSEDAGTTWRASTAGLPSSGNAWMLAASNGGNGKVLAAITSDTAQGSGVYELLQKNSPPLAPQALHVQETGTGTSMLLYWQPAFYCAAPIAEYLVYYGNKSGMYSDTISSRLDTGITLTQLQEGTRYFAT